jgi:stress response protein SCP2
MTTLTGPQKGEEGELKIFHEGKRRFLVGLAWTPRELPRLDIHVSDVPKSAAGKIAHYLMLPLDFIRVLVLSFAKLIAFDMHGHMSRKDGDKAGRDKNAVQFDLDLDCYIFDKDFKFLCTVSAEDDDHLLDPSQKVYHSGDDQSGMGGGDSEQVFVETNGLPENYHHIFFVVRSDCMHSLDRFGDPKIRLADGKTGDNALHTAIVPETEEKKYGYVFCRVFRNGEGWRFQNIDTCMEEGVEWEKFLPYLAEKKAA